MSGSRESHEECSVKGSGNTYLIRSLGIKVLGGVDTQKPVLEQHTENMFELFDHASHPDTAEFQRKNPTIHPLIFEHKATGVCRLLLGKPMRGQDHRLAEEYGGKS